MARKAKISSEVYEDNRIIDTEYSDIMQQSYIDYSMSVITDRALPDIRDGLKPVQRRILYDMERLGITSDKQYRKVARIVGDTMGKYHPHGDASIENALVVQAQDFKRNFPLIDGHGNFGSIEGDQHAAARYIEAKLHGFTETVFLSELKYGTVDYHDNYDGTEKEPNVLPVLVPNFLLNGSEGIAVGMTTSVPSHNIGEIIDGEIAYLNNPKIPLNKIMEYIKGPDFSTGGIVANQSDLEEIYRTGTGKIRVRGKMEVEKLKGGKTNLVITEIPYTMIGSGITKFLEDVATLSENHTIPDITDISNQSSKEGIRIVIELRKGADIKTIQNIIYKKTKLEDTFGVNMLAIANGKPEICPLLSVYKYHSEFLYEIHERKYTNLLAKENEQLEIQEGLIKAIDLIDLIIAVLRGSSTQKDAKHCLMTGDTEKIKLKTKALQKQASKLSFTERQADAILAMRLSRLIGLELNALENERERTQKNIEKYKKLLSSKKEMTKDIVNSLTSIKKKYDKKRKTKITNIEDAGLTEIAIEEKDVMILIDRFGYVRTMDRAVYERNKEAAEKESKYQILAKNVDTLYFVTNVGKYYKIPILSLPYGTFRGKAEPVDNYAGKAYDKKDERPVYFGILEQSGKHCLFATKKGFLKRMETAELDGVKRNGTQIIKLDDGDSLVAFTTIKKESHVFLVTNKGLYLKAIISQIPPKKKNARGIIGVKTDPNECVETVEFINQTEKKILSINGRDICVSDIKAGKTGKKGKELKSV